MERFGQDNLVMFVPKNKKDGIRVICGSVLMRTIAARCQKVSIPVLHFSAMNFSVTLDLTYANLRLEIFERKQEIN